MEENGNSFENPIVVRALNERDGRYWEGRRLSDMFGLEDRDWKLESYERQRSKEGIPCDIMHVELKDGTRKSTYFDISAFIGEGPIGFPGADKFDTELNGKSDEEIMEESRKRGEAEIKAALEKNEMSLKVFDARIKSNPNDAATRFSKNRLLKQLGRYEDALMEVDVLLEIDPDNKAYQNEKATILNCMKKS